MSLKPSVWFGLIVRPAHQVTHGENRRWLDAGNRFMTEARSRIGTGHTRFFSENQTAHLDSSVARRSQADNEGMHEVAPAKGGSGRDVERRRSDCTVGQQSK